MLLYVCMYYVHPYCADRIEKQAQLATLLLLSTTLIFANFGALFDLRNACKK